MLSPSSSVSSDDVADILSQSTDPWNTDYSLYIQARLFDAAQRIPTIRSVDDLLIYFLSFYCILYCFRKPCADSSLPAIVFSDAEKVKAFLQSKRARNVLSWNLKVGIFLAEFYLVIVIIAYGDLKSNRWKPAWVEVQPYNNTQDSRSIISCLTFM